MKAHIDIDTGGTFTDAFVVLNGRSVYGKAPTTPHRLSEGCMEAIRVAAEELDLNLEQLLASSPDVLKKGGSIAVVSYHSLEDRMVKHNFRQNAQNDIYAVLTKKPIVPSEAEIRENPRARSAKLRIARRK